LDQLQQTAISISFFEDPSRSVKSLVLSILKIYNPEQRSNGNEG
jgi:hypothetical protein